MASTLEWEFPKIGVPYFGVLIIRVLLFGVGSPIFGNSRMMSVKAACGSTDTVAYRRRMLTAEAAASNHES